MEEGREGLTDGRPVVLSRTGSVEGASPTTKGCPVPRDRQRRSLYRMPGV